MSLAWTGTPVIPALGRLKQEDFNFEAPEQELVSKIKQKIIQANKKQKGGRGREREERRLERWFHG